MIWMYAVCDRPDLPLPRAQPPLEGLREGLLVAVYTRSAPSVDTPAPDALWAHERVVERLMAARTVVPVRFGTTCRDEDDVRCLLVDHQAWFLALLARVRGCVELGLRVVHNAPGAAGVAVRATRTGRHYLYERIQEGRQATKVSSEIDDPLTRLAVET